MKLIPELIAGPDFLSAYADSKHNSPGAFAAELNVPEEWVRYWLELAEIKRRGYAGFVPCD